MGDSHWAVGCEVASGTDQGLDEHESDASYHVVVAPILLIGRVVLWRFATRFGCHLPFCMTCL